MTLDNSENWILPEWPAPSSVKALTTLKTGAGFSEGPYARFNFGWMAGDAEEHVLANRRLLKELAGLPSDPVWLDQVHGIDCLLLSSYSQKMTTQEVIFPKADAAIADQPNQVCAVKTADCLPVLLCNTAGSKVAAIHAGWRGLSAGVVENTVKKMQENPENILAWLGPAIGPLAFEVGQDVLEAFNQPGDQVAFKSRSPDRWLADLYLLARLRLNKLGIKKIYGGNFCTYTETDRFYSYRRAQKSGRMVSLIWMVK